MKKINTLNDKESNQLNEHLKIMMLNNIRISKDEYFKHQIYGKSMQF